MQFLKKLFSSVIYYRRSFRLDYVLKLLRLWPNAMQVRARDSVFSGRYWGCIRTRIVGLSH